MLIVHDPRCADYGSSLRPEQPSRITRTAPFLRQKHPAWEWREPPPLSSDNPLLLAHTQAHLNRLARPVDFDPDTPFLDGIPSHARRAVSAALEAASSALSSSRPAFSLMRPPGHHATSSQAMGFCYLNQIAIAALFAQTHLGASRVAIWDFDAHHGNGTEAILKGRPGMLFTSVHQYPGYPGTGTQDDSNCRNWPVAPRSPRPVHMAALRASWEAVLSFRPDLILVSAGFDAYAQDPLTALSLECQDFAELGRWLKNAPVCAAAVLEGGYSDDLPELIDSFLSAWDAE